MPPPLVPSLGSVVVVSDESELPEPELLPSPESPDRFVRTVSSLDPLLPEPDPELPSDPPEPPEPDPEWSSVEFVVPPLESSLPPPPWPEWLPSEPERSPPECSCVCTGAGALRWERGEVVLAEWWVFVAETVRALTVTIRSSIRPPVAAWTGAGCELACAGWCSEERIPSAAPPTTAPVAATIATTLATAA